MLLGIGARLDLAAQGSPVQPDSNTILQMLRNAQAQHHQQGLAAPQDSLAEQVRSGTAGQCLLCIKAWLHMATPL